MNSHLLSKFNEDGSVLSSRLWTHFTHIGRTIDKTQISLDDYLIVEGWYLDFFQELCASLQVKKFTLRWFEDNRYPQHGEEPRDVRFVKVIDPWFGYIAGHSYSADYLGDLTRLGLRNLMVFEAEAGQFFLRSFDDMYFYIEAPEHMDLSRIAKKHRLAVGKFDKYERQAPVFLDNLLDG